jgi:hypoxanthine-guanine phosphoribosyltransferase
VLLELQGLLVLAQQAQLDLSEMMDQLVQQASKVKLVLLEQLELLEQMELQAQLVCKAYPELFMLAFGMEQHHIMLETL